MEVEVDESGDAREKTKCKKMKDRKDKKKQNSKSSKNMKKDYGMFSQRMQRMNMLSRQIMEINASIKALVEQKNNVLFEISNLLLEEQRQSVE